MANKFIIYCLIDPRHEDIFYIGRSSSGLRRAKHHLQPSVFKKKNYPVYKKIQDELVDFNVRATCANEMRSTGKMPTGKFIKALFPYEKKQLKNLMFFKNGDYASIPNGE